MAGLETESTMIAWAYGIITLLATVLILMVARAITFRILGQIGGEPEMAVAVAHAVAEGKLDTDIRLRAGDRDSLLASMKRMQEQLLERIGRERQQANESLRIKIALDNVSTGVMIADTDRRIIYVNRSVQRLLKAAQEDICRQLPGFDADRLVGTNIDTFHRNPQHQAQLLAKFTSTYAADLEIGGRSMTVSANPVINEAGERIGSVAEWRWNGRWRRSSRPLPGATCRGGWRRRTSPASSRPWPLP
jgi:methyl-accepting chemotaxis protein